MMFCCFDKIIISDINYIGKPLYIKLLNYFRLIIDNNDPLWRYHYQ